MYMLTLKDRTTDGAYAIADKNGDKVLLMFEETDDAERYAMYLETVSYTHLTLPTICSV